MISNLVDTFTHFHFKIQDNHDDELEEFCQSANHLHDINQNKRNNEEFSEVDETKKEENVVSDLIDLQQQNQQFLNDQNLNNPGDKCDTSLENLQISDRSVVEEDLNLTISS